MFLGKIKHGYVYCFEDIVNVYSKCVCVVDKLSSQVTSQVAIQAADFYDAAYERASGSIWKPKIPKVC